MKNIYSFAREVADDYEKQEVEFMDGLEINMHEEIREVEFMTNQQYISGNEDENGDLKPFMDIVNRALENQRTSEEVDTKDTQIATHDPDFFTRINFLSKYNMDWMEENAISIFHNEAIETRGKYGGVLAKVVETDDNISIEIADWTEFSGDAADLKDGVKVFNHYYTPAGLLEVAEERGWDIEEAKKAIELYAEADQDDELKKQRETNGEYILVKEVSGVLPKTFIDEEADEHEYSYQLHYVAGAEYHSDSNEGSVEHGSTLSSVEPKDKVYYYLPYKKRTVSSKVLGFGVVQLSKHAQIQTNIAAQHYADSLDYASSIALQSASKNLKGKNVITGMKKGTILNHDDGKPIQAVDMTPSSLQFLGSYMEQWQQQLNDVTGTYGIATGDTSDLPANMTYRLGAIVDQNSQSAPDLRREEYEQWINTIWKERIIPWQIKQLQNKEELKLKFSPEELKKLDQDIAKFRADEIIVDSLLNGDFDDVPVPMRMEVMRAQRDALLDGVMKQLKKGKNRRGITDFPDDYWDLDTILSKAYVDITGERENKKATLETSTSILTQYVNLKPILDQDPNARKIFNGIVQKAGMEPISFEESIATPQEQSQQQGSMPGTKSDSVLSSPEKLTAKPQ